MFLIFNFKRQIRTKDNIEDDLFAYVFTFIVLNLLRKIKKISIVNALS